MATARCIAKEISSPVCLHKIRSRRSSSSRLVELSQDGSNLLELNRFCKEQVHAAGKGLVLGRDVAQAGDGDDGGARAAGGLLKAADGARRLEAIHHGHVDVHEDDVRLDDGNWLLRGVGVGIGGEVGVGVGAVRGGALLVHGTFVQFHGLAAILRSAVWMSGSLCEYFEEAEIDGLGQTGYSQWEFA